MDNLCVCSSEKESKENCACVSPFYRRKHGRDTAVGMRLLSYRAVSRRREGSDTSLIIPFMVLTFRTI